MRQYKKRLYIDLSWVNPKSSGGGHYASKKITNTIIKNNEFHKNFEIIILGRREYFQKNKFSKKIKIITIPNFYPINFLLRFFLLLFLSNKNLTQIFFCPNIYMPIFKGNFKVINLIYDNQWKYFPEYFSYIKILWLKFNIFLTQKNSDKIICESKFIRDEFKFLKKKIEVIYIPFNISPKKIARKKNLKEKYYFILSSMLPHKNIDIIENLFLNCSIKSDVKKIIIAGIGGINKIVRNKNKKIVYLGKISDKKKQKLYKNCELYIFPSKYEGFGMTIIEALIYRKKIVCSDLPVLREVGKEFPIFVKDISSNKNWIKSIEASQDKKLPIKTLNNYLKKFSEKKISQKYLSIFKKI